MKKQRIKDLLPRRSDLSTFVIHLTRDTDESSAKDALVGILKSGRIEARNAYGHAVSELERKELSLDSQKVVCFTETPLEYLYLLLGEIENRQCQMAPYGIALTKKKARVTGINPVWYIDISPTGKDWLSNSINELIRAAIESGKVDDAPIFQLTPFIEQMGSGKKLAHRKGYRKEFWWEREWRHQDDYTIPERFIILAPEDEFDEVREKMPEAPSHRYGDLQFVDPRWGLEQIIAHLAGFQKDEIDII